MEEYGLLSLNLKAGFWQVEMDESSKPLTCLYSRTTLVSSECGHMTFGLTNVPAAFQRLMESHLVDLHLSWCIIYLDGVIVLVKTSKRAFKLDMGSSPEIKRRRFKAQTIQM